MALRAFSSLFVAEKLRKSMKWRNLENIFCLFVEKVSEIGIGFGLELGTFVIDVEYSGCLEGFVEC